MLVEPLLSHLKVRLAEQVGLSFSGNGWRDFERRIAAAAKEDGAGSVLNYVDQLLSTPLTQSQIERLAGHLTVGETYFFREKHSFDALADHILPKLLRARELTQRRLRIWSAGCCSGEEAYSIAILLDRLLPQQEGWDISIIGTDINPKSLHKAKRAVYGDWSFRETPEWVRENYFKKKANGNYELLPRIRRRVKFSYLNLADDNYSSVSARLGRLDIIFCRNVLMYFSREQAAGVVGRFRDALHEDGLLLVSPAETSATLFSGFSQVNYPGAIFYRSRARQPLSGRAAPLTTASLPIAQTVIPVIRPANRPEAPELIAAEQVTLAAPVNDEYVSGLASKARRCADEGKLNDAAHWCSKAVAADKLNPAFHYLLAAIEQERGMVRTAVQALQRTLYLDQDFVLAHFALANLRLAEGRRDEADRHLEIARKLLGKCSPDALLPESEGLTAARLGEIVAALKAGLVEPYQNVAVYK